ncbi:hypothetical protein GCM10027024_25840 [Microbacterium insulae]
MAWPVAAGPGALQFPTGAASRDTACVANCSGNPLPASGRGRGLAAAEESWRAGRITEAEFQRERRAAYAAIA